MTLAWKLMMATVEFILVEGRVPVGLMSEPAVKHLRWSVAERVLLLLKWAWFLQPLAERGGLHNVQIFLDRLPCTLPGKKKSLTQIDLVFSLVAGNTQI